MPPQQRSPMVDSDYACYPEQTLMSQKVTEVKRRTRFALSKNEVFPIPHINDLSDEEVQDTWYEKADYDNMKADIIPIVRRVMKGEKIKESNEITVRGLEYRTRKGAIRRQHNKVEAITAVLDEQDRQIELDIVDDELIAEVYIECSAHCLVEAQKLAEGDVAAATDYLLTPTSRTTEDYEKGGDFKKAPDRKTSFRGLLSKMSMRKKSFSEEEKKDDKTSQ